MNQLPKPKPYAHNPKTKKLFGKIYRKHKLDPDAKPFTSKQVRKIMTGYSHSFQHWTLLAICMHAMILTLLKPGERKCQSVLYRPILLLCPASKDLEKLIIKRFNLHVRLTDTRHGFRTVCSTTTALLPLVKKAALGFNKRNAIHWSVALGVDFSKVFKNVDHTSKRLNSRKPAPDSSPLDGWYPVKSLPTKSPRPWAS